MNTKDQFQLLELLQINAELLQAWGKGDDREITVLITQISDLLKSRNDRLHAESLQKVRS